MVSDYTKILKENLNLKAILLLLLLLVVGIISVEVSTLVMNDILKTLFIAIGSSLFITALITVLWDIIGKRALIKEAMAIAQLSTEFEASGITKIYESFNDIEVSDWNLLFDSVTQLDIFVAYARTWRRTYADRLSEVAKNKDARIRVVLLDPNDNQVMTEVAMRFGYEPDQLKDYIEEHKSFFKELSDNNPGGARIEVWFQKTPLNLSFYRFDEVIVLALYTRREHGVAIPTFFCKDGTLSEFVREEFLSVVKKDGTGRLVVGEQEADDCE